MRTVRFRNIILIAVSMCVSLLLLVSALFISAVVPASAYTETAYFIENNNFDLTYDYSDQYYKFTTEIQCTRKDGLKVARDTSDVESISFNLHMEDVTKLSYYPTITFYDSNQKEVNFQFCSWNKPTSTTGVFELKHTKATIQGLTSTLKNIPYDTENFTFDGKFKIVPNGRNFTFYLNDELFYDYVLPEHYVYTDDSSIFFGLKLETYATTDSVNAPAYPSGDFYFYNVNLDITNAPVITEFETTSKTPAFIKILSILCLVAFVYVVLWLIFRYLYYGDKKKNQ